jgi:hypothetical protein
MKRALQILVILAVLIIGIGLLLPIHQVIYGVGSRTVEFIFLIVDEETWSATQKLVQMV